VNPQIPVDLAGLLELDRARDVGAYLAAVPAVERAFEDDHHQEMLGVRRPDAILVLNAEHARHRRRVRSPEPHAPAIVGRQHPYAVYA
jgi:hypothetical protein